MNPKIKNITLTFCLTLALMLMFSQELLHHHHHEIGDYKHQECPVCLLSITSANSAILNESSIISEPQICYVEAIIESNTSISNNYISLCFPDRAPPQR
ncbi:MAG: hypothetical protein WC139_13360 [Candidatus Kapaibacterium sp.]